MTRRIALLLAGALALGPARADAWDARATHLGMLDRALVGSALHLRWMAASDRSFGVTSSTSLGALFATCSSMPCTSWRPSNAAACAFTTVDRWVATTVPASTTV